MRLSTRVQGPYWFVYCRKETKSVSVTSTTQLVSVRTAKTIFITFFLEGKIESPPGDLYNRVSKIPVEVVTLFIRRTFSTLSSFVLSLFYLYRNNFKDLGQYGPQVYIGF